MSSKSTPIVPLADERRSYLPTAEAAQHLNRKPATLRGWGRTPPIGSPQVLPMKVGTRLLWPVAELKRVLGVM